MTNNISAVETQSGKYQNWIEFHNSNDIDIDLTDFKLEIEQSGSLKTFKLSNKFGCKSKFVQSLFV